MTCECGCGQAVKHGRRFVNAGHAGRSSYEVRDRGYRTPCWVWTGDRNEHGYARGMRDGRRHAMHRWFYERACGPIPADKVLDHLCSVPACVNPDHLEPVPQAENCRRGRKALLTVERVREIRVRVAAGEAREAVARAFGVSLGAVTKIVLRERWADVA